MIYQGWISEDAKAEQAALDIKNLLKSRHEKNVAAFRFENLLQVIVHGYRSKEEALQDRSRIKSLTGAAVKEEFKAIDMYDVCTNNCFHLESTGFHNCD